MKSLARFAIRPADDTYQKGDMIIGALFKEQDATLLKPNHVYEIQEIMGVLTLVDMGESAMGMYPVEAKTCSPAKGWVTPGWCSEIGHLLSVGQGNHLITRDEIQRDLFTNWLTSD